MRPLAVMTSLAATLLASVLALAQPSLVLTDGQTIKGNEIKRQGDTYFVTMEDGNTATFPVALVKEIKLVDDPRPNPPPGFDFTPPRTLAGPVKQHSQDPKDQLRVLGPPSRWTPNIIDPTWTPISAYDPNKDVLAASRSTWAKSAIDTTWTPKSAYDYNKDVFALTRATWAKNVIDTTWEPTDSWGFKPLGREASTPTTATNYPTEAALAREATSPQAPAPVGATDPWVCADKLFAQNSQESPSMTVKKLDTPLYAYLGMPLYEAHGNLDGASRTAIFSIAGDQCRLVGGDTDALIGLNLSADHAIGQSGASFNAALASSGATGIPKGVDKIDYAFAFVALTDPTASGSTHAELRIIGRPEEIRSIAAKTPDTCTLNKAKRNKEQRTAAAAYAIPKALAGSEGDVITFLTWSSAGGTFYKNTVVLGRDGTVSAKREPIATHVGFHRD